MKTVADSRAKYAEVQNEIIKQTESGQKQQATEGLLVKLRPLQNDYMKAVDNLIEFQGKLVEKAGKDAKDEYAFSRNMILIALAASFVIALLLIISSPAASPGPWPKPWPSITNSPKAT